MPSKRFIAVLAVALSMAPAAFAADTLELAKKQVHYTGGVTLLLRKYVNGMANTTGAPEIFVQNFDKALAENQALINQSDEAIARVYASLYAADQLSAEVAFYESPEAQAIMVAHPGPYGTVLWPEPGAGGLTAEQSAALTKFHATVAARAGIAAKNPDATDAIMSAETNALIKIRAAAFADYCQVRDCKAENVTPPQ